MKKAFFFLFIFNSFVLGSMAQDCLVTPISLENKILNSDLIIEGEVISKSCSWDHAHRLIYTTYLFRIHTRFNGTAPGSHILVCTPGGIIGDTALILEPGFGMEPGEKGVLFLKPLLNLPTGVFQLPVFEPYSWTQGFYRYILQCDVAISALDYRHGIDSLKNYIVSLTRQSHVLLPAFNLPVTTVGGSSLFAPPPPPPPQIAGFSPGSISAGTMSLLTINGANFGNSPGAVSFNLAVATSGQWIPALPSEIISWTNNQIEVLVPSGAGTGSFRVTDAFGIQTLSPLPLTVIYNHLNHNNSTQRFMLRNINQSTWGGINWEVHSLLSGNMPAFNSFKRAVSTWRCATGINWTVSGSGTVNYVSFDNVSAVIWDSNLPVGVLGVCYGYHSVCNGEWYQGNRDIAFQPGFNWQYGPALPTTNEYDFETVALHELGHAHLVGHIISPGAVMHPTASNGFSNRVLSSTSDIACGSFIMARSVAIAGCGNSSMVPIPPGSCSIFAPMVSFSANPQWVCPGNSVQFSDNSTGNPSAWAWSFPGGSPATSSIQNPLINYPIPGIYNVSLTVSNASGIATTTQNSYITVGPPTATINGSSTIYLGYNATLRFDFTGQGPWSLTYTDGVTPVVVNGITSNPYYVFVSPATTTTYSIAAFNDNNCNGVGIGNAIVTVQPMPANVTGLGLPFWGLGTKTSGNSLLLDWTNQNNFDTIPFGNVNDYRAGMPALNSCGEPVFWIFHPGMNLANKLYPISNNGTILSTPMNGQAYYIEVQVILVPEKEDEWYVIYNQWGVDVNIPSNLLWSKIKWECDSLRYLVKDSVLRANGINYQYSTGLALSANVPGSPSNFYLYAARKSTSMSTISLDRFLLTPSNIGWSANTGPVNAPYWNLSGSVAILEVSHSGDKIVYRNASQSQGPGINDVYIFDASQFSNGPGAFFSINFNNLILQPDGIIHLAPSAISAVSISNPQLLFLRNFGKKLHFIEVSPSGQFLYVAWGGYAAGGYTNITYLAQIDLFSPPPFNLRLQIQSPPGGTYNSTSGAGCTFASGCLPNWLEIRHIESSYDGNLYFTKLNSDTLYVIPNPNSPMPQLLTPGNVDLSIPGFPNLISGLKFDFLPDQIDGYVYSRGSANLVDIPISITGCNGCLASNSSPQYVNLISSGGSMVKCLEIISCPDTSTVCINSDSIYSIIYGGLRIDSAIVWGVLQQNLFQFHLSNNPLILIDTIPFLCDTFPIVNLNAFPIGGSFSGVGVSGNQFNPVLAGVGQHWIYYSYTDPQTHCTSIDSTLAIVYSCCVFAPDSFSMVVDSSPCANSPTGRLQLFLSGGFLTPYQYSLDGVNYFPSCNFNFLSGGNYFLTIMNIAGCDTIIPFSIYSPPLITSGALVTDVSCNGMGDGSISLNPGGGTPGYLFSLNGSLFQSSMIFTGLSGGNYSCQIQDSNNCIYPFLIPVSEPPPIIVQVILHKNIYCFGENDGEIQLNATGGVPGYLFSINNGPFASNLHFQNLSSGNYSIVVKDQNNCTENILLTITEPPLLNLTIDTVLNVSCNGESNGAVFSQVSGGAPGYQFSINGLSNGISPVFQNLRSGNHQIAVTDQNGCTTAIQVEITEPPALFLSLSSSNNVSCPGKMDGSITINATGGIPVYSFSINGSPPQSSGFFPNLSSGSYSIKVEDSNGCSEDFQQLILEESAPQSEFDLTFDRCENPLSVTVSINSLPGYSFDWDLGDGNTFSGAAFTYTYSLPGNYLITLVVTNPQNCSSLSIESAQMAELPIAHFSTDPMLPIELRLDHNNLNFENLSQNSTHYSWDFGDGTLNTDFSPFHHYSVGGDFCPKLIAWNLFECADTFEQCGLKIAKIGWYYPTAFSPNGDGLNDHFKIVCTSKLRYFNLQIFDRWGKLIFHSTDLNVEWDGTFNGIETPEGVYTFMVIAETTLNEILSSKGTITLIR